MDLVPLRQIALMAPLAILVSVFNLLARIVLAIAPTTLELAKTARVSAATASRTATRSATTATRSPATAATIVFRNALYVIFQIVCNVPPMEMSVFQNAPEAHVLKVKNHAARLE